MQIAFEKLVSRNLVRALSTELDLAGMKVTLERFLRLAIVGAFAILIAVAFVLALVVRYPAGIAALLGLGGAALYEVMLYVILEFKVDQRKSFVEGILPDYLQITAANVRSGISLDKAMILAARPEFKYFSDDVTLMSKQLYAGETMQNGLLALGKHYRSLQLQHTVRMMTEAIRYGGGMTDLLNQIAKDLRNQEMVQKEIAGQLFMYSIFITFAAIIAAPVIYALTTQMMTITDTVWAGILKQNPGGLPTAGISFLRPSPPKITIPQYHDFTFAAILIITAFAAFIVSAISSGSAIKGIRYLPIFVIVGLVIFFVVNAAIGGLFSTISGV